MSVTLTYYRMSQERLSYLENNFDIETEPEPFYSEDKNIPPTCLVYYGQPLNGALVLDIQKEHAALHYLLTGTEQEKGESILFDVVHGGRETSLECSYGYCHCLDTDEVKSIARALNQLPDATLRARLDARLAGPMYGQNDTWDEDDWELLRPVVEYVREFFALAAQHEQIILISWE